MSDSERAWIGFSRFQVPTVIAREGTLPGVEAIVLLVLFRLANATTVFRETEARIRVSIRRLVTLTGLADKTVRRALEELEANKFLTVQRSRKKNDSQFGSNTYTLLHPEMGHPLKVEQSRGICHLNGLSYFPVPSDVVRCLGRLRLSERFLYIALLIVAGRNESLTFTAATPILAKLAGLSPKTLALSLKGLELAGLIIREAKGRYTLCDPVTREPANRCARGKDNPRNWTIDGKNALDYDDLTAPQWKLVIDACFKHSYIYAEKGWTARARCPFHSGDGKPTFSFNFEEGAFICHSKKCEAKGKLSRFVKRLRKLNEQETQEFIARCIGVELTLNRPAKDASKVWRYFNETHALVKEVLFFEDDGTIREKPVGRKLLYHLPEVQESRTVVVLRNEADCDHVETMQLKDHGGRSMATTTGGYITGWLPKFAADLKGKNVVIMHVSDRGGTRFYKQVADSLDDLDISYRHIAVKENTSISILNLKKSIGTDWLYDETQTDSEKELIQI